MLLVLYYLVFSFFKFDASAYLNVVDGANLQCHTVTKLGLTQYCCGQGILPAGQKCQGDLAGDTPGGACEANEILGPEADGKEYFGDSAPVVTGGICYIPSKCRWMTWQYVFSCCPCPSGYKILNFGLPTPNCDPSALWVGCTGANEVLVGENNSTGFSCSTVTLATSSTASLHTSTTKFANLDDNASHIDDISTHVDDDAAYLDYIPPHLNPNPPYVDNIPPHLDPPPPPSSKKPPSTSTQTRSSSSHPPSSSSASSRS